MALAVRLRWRQPDSARGWFESLEQDERQRALDALGATPDQVASRMVDAAYASAAETCIVPLQDFLGLGTEARMKICLCLSRRSRLAALPGEGIRLAF